MLLNIFGLLENFLNIFLIKNNGRSFYFIFILSFASLCVPLATASLWERSVAEIIQIEFVNISNNKATLVPCVFIFELLTQWASHRDAERKPHCC